MKRSAGVGTSMTDARPSAFEYLERARRRQTRSGFLLLLGAPVLAIASVLLWQSRQRPVYEAHGSVVLAPAISRVRGSTDSGKRLLGDEAVLLQTEDFRRRVLEQLSAEDRARLTRMRPGLSAEVMRRKAADGTARALAQIRQVKIARSLRERGVTADDALVSDTFVLSIDDDNADPVLAAGLVNATIRASLTANLVVSGERAARTRRFIEAKLKPLAMKIAVEEVEERRVARTSSSPFEVRTVAPPAGSASPRAAQTAGPAGRKERKAAARAVARRPRGLLDNEEIGVAQPGEDPTLSYLDAALDQARLEQRMAVVRLRLAQTLGAPALGNDEGSESGALRRRLEAQLDDARSEYASTADSLGASNPEREAGLARMDALRRELQRVDERRIEEAQRSVQETAARSAALRAAAAAERAKAETGTEQQAKTAFLELSLALDLNTLALMRERLSTVNSDLALGEPLVEMVDQAQVPLTPLHHSLRAVLVLAGGGGLVLGFAAVVMLQMLQLDRWSVGEVEEAAERPVLAILRELKGADSKETTRELEEALHGLRDAMTWIRGARTGLVVSFASSMPAEGTTTIVAASAFLLARAGARVLVVDTNLYRPALARTFGRYGEVGLSHVLAGAASLGAAVQPVLREPGGGGMLDVLGTGCVPVDPFETLRSGVMQDLLREAGGRYDYVLLDSCLTRGLNGMVVSDQVNAVVMVARYGRVDLRALRARRDVLKRAGMPISAVVINGVPC